jgi:hypothetical protein
MPMPQPYAPGTAASHVGNSQDALANPLREMASLLITTGRGRRDWAAMERSPSTFYVWSGSEEGS